MSRLGVLGAGAWGTALALIAAQAGHEVALWGRDKGQIDEIRRTRENAKRLPGVRLPTAIEPVTEIAPLLTADTILLAVPAQALRQACAPFAATALTLVICAKGVERGTGLVLSEVVRAVCSEAKVAALSGPSFALEVARGLPTAVTVAAKDVALARRLAELLAVRSFRPYPTDDLLGVEIGGALKNVIAIASGAVIGRELGENARAALITRGLAEMARLAEALGARRETLMGLSGLGDLMLTATSLTSRNTRFGYELGRGKAPQALMGLGQPLAEGAWTAQAACELARRVGVELPIIEAVTRVVAGEMGIDDAVQSLLARPLKDSETA
jgi:glycerol-3-phosphate dehydrogenase (NAD(P)+)